MHVHVRIFTVVLFVSNGHVPPLEAATIINYLTCLLLKLNSNASMAKVHPNKQLKNLCRAPKKYFAAASCIPVWFHNKQAGRFQSRFIVSVCLSVCLKLSKEEMESNWAWARELLQKRKNISTVWIKQPLPCNALSLYLFSFHPQ